MSNLPKIEIPEFLLEMSKRLNEQDNECNSDPIYYVCYDEYHVSSDGYHDKIQWFDHDEGIEICDEFDHKKMKDHLASNYEAWLFMNYPGTTFDAVNPDFVRLPDSIEKLYVKKHMVKERACLTRADAEAFIKRKQHDYKKLYIVVGSMYFCPEMMELRNWIKGINKQNENE